MQAGDPAEHPSTGAGVPGAAGEATGLRWVDTHCHLDSLNGDLAAFLERAWNAGVEHLVTIGTDPESSRTAIGLAERHDRVWAAVGVHPHDAENFNGDAADAIEEMAGHDRVVAVGEVGMDFYRDYAGAEAQDRTFRAQIQVAKRVNKPMVMHIRDAFDEVLAVLGEVGPPERLIFHCFSGNVANARQALRLGGYVSFAGNVSYRNAEPLRDAARAVPLDRLLVETDSPYLAPHPHRGKPNEPSYVPKVGAALAAALGQPVEEVAEATSANARRVFALPA
ncbi:MAG: TatD family hydrolase [Actinomycetota bacterium]